MFFHNIYLYIKYLSIYEIFRYEIIRKIFTKIFVNNKSTSFKISRATASNFSIVLFYNLQSEFSNKREIFGSITLASP